jgi:hypothetical protein
VVKRLVEGVAAVKEWTMRLHCDNIAAINIANNPV